MTPIQLTKGCPTCKNATVILEHNRLRCSTSGCPFETTFDCPICDGSLDQATQSTDLLDTFLTCPGCKNTIGLKKIKYMIDNGMQLDYTERCGLCNSPTIHRATMNLGHRCFFFPKCSGQTDLFGAVRESFTFLDFETTGLEIGRDYLIEVGALKIDEDGYEHVFQSLIKPPVPISPKITQITGITNDMVANSPPLLPVLKSLVDFIGTSKLVIHNADFDMLWLLSGVIRHNLNLSDTQVICTLKWARSMGEAQASLGALTRKYGIGHANAHRALADAAATRELFFIFDRNNKVPRPHQTVSDFKASTQKLVDRYPDYVQF